MKREKDVLKVEKVNSFLDKNFYEKLGIKTYRITDTQMQKKGVDVIWETESGQFLIDEKTSIDYIDKKLNTFAFELSALNNKNSEGWFIPNDYHITTHYLIMYPKGNREPFQIENFTAYLVKKDKLWEYLRKYNFDYKNIITNIREGKIKPSSINYYGNETYNLDIPYVRIVYSKNLPEKPINILFEKTFLDKMAENRFFCSEKNLSLRKKINKNIS